MPKASGTKQVLNMLQDQVYPENPKLAEERDIILQETRLILDKTLELGEGDWALGAVRAFAAGVIDVPFAPSSHNAGRTMPARTMKGPCAFVLGQSSLYQGYSGFPPGQIGRAGQSRTA